MADTLSIPVPGPAELHLTTRSGRVTVIAEGRDDVLIEAGAPSRDRIEVDPTGRIALTSANHGSAGLEVRCPVGSDLAIGTLSGSVELRGQVGRARVTTMSGSIKVESAEELDVRTFSGTIEIARCSGRCLLRTKSGRAVCISARDARVSTVSGQIRLEETTGSVRAQSVSGTIEVGTQRDGDVAIQTISGAVKVEVPKGIRPMALLRSMSGRPRCDCEQGSDCRIAVQSISGRIEVVPA